MIITVTGGSASGKSEYAENVAVKLNNNCENFYYIATMKPFDNECEKRIEKHRFMRKNKGFHTIECYEDLSTIQIQKDSTVLLECMSNFTANIMYGENKVENVVEFTQENIGDFSKKVKNLVIVTNEVFADGIEYDESTAEYIENLGKINQHIATLSDNVIEVVYKIPVVHKGEDLLK